MNQQLLFEIHHARMSNMLYQTQHSRCYYLYYGMDLQHEKVHGSGKCYGLTGSLAPLIN